MAERIKPIGSGKPDISVVDAALVTLTKEIAEVRSEIRLQRSDNNGIIIGVLIAVVLIVATVATEVMHANKLIGDEFDVRFNLESKLNGQQIQINDLENTVSNIKIRNPYLK